eukprot:3482611-Prymnesium_polylepis.2
MGREYAPAFYRHQQTAESPPLLDGDDFYAPVQPKMYIELRIQPSITFYRKRIPKYATQRYALKSALMACTFAATLLTRYQLSVWVVAVTSATAGITSWQEFADTARKTERYTRAVFALTNLLSWWNSLGEVSCAVP